MWASCLTMIRYCSHASMHVHGPSEVLVRELLGVELVVNVSVTGASDGPGEHVVEGDDDGVVDNINDEGSLVSRANGGKGSGLSIEEVDESVDGLGEGNSSTPGGNTDDEAVGEVSVGVVEGIAGIGVLGHVLREVHGEVVGGGNEHKSKEQPHDDPEDGEETHKATDDRSATIDEVGRGVASVGGSVKSPEGGLDSGLDGLHTNPATGKGADDHHNNGASGIEEGNEEGDEEGRGGRW